jgi:transporter family-2 protein
MTTPTAQSPNPLHLLAAFGTGDLLTLMIHFNGELARYNSASHVARVHNGRTKDEIATDVLALLR